MDDKLSQVLTLFLSKNYKVESTTYLDLLLTQISSTIIDDKKDNGKEFTLLKEWIVEGLTIWDVNIKPCQPVSVFLLKLVGTIGKDEDDFDYLHKHNVFHNLLNIFSLQSNDLSASIKMAYTTMLLDIINHKSGRKLIKSTGVWKDVVKFAQLNQTMYVTRESHKFIFQLLIFESNDTEFCKEMILFIADPLLNNKFDGKIHSALEELYLDQTKLLCTTLELLTSIFENTLFIGLDNTIPNLVENTVNLESKVVALFEACISTKFLQYVQKLRILLLFSTLKSGLKADSHIADEFYYNKFCLGYSHCKTMLISKKFIIEIIKSSKIGLIYWHKLQKIHTFEAPRQYKLQNQLITLMITPMCTCLRKNQYNHDILELFLDKIFTVTNPTAQRLVYLMRDVLIKEDLPIEMICKSSIEMILEIIDILDRDTAVMVFQSMCHVLKNYAPNICKQSDNNFKYENNRKRSTRSILEGDPIVDSPILLSTLLHGLAVITEKFQFKWSDCVETICVLSLAQEILNHSGVSSHLCVKALQLCKIAIQNFMPPNLALLVDSDSHMNDIGPTFYKRLHDTHWEVRDSVLEVLTTIAEISEAKYPAFQELLLRNKFPQVVTDIAITDGESYVRASSLKFIATSVRINYLWEKELSKLELPEKTIKLLNEESEAIVRREAVVLLKELYVSRKWTKSTIDLMTEAMASAVVLDLHWEVKVNALEFWRHFIISHLTDQGMLDGFFPSVTFSKENRKIVSLNESEIKRRLLKALDEMARQYCLGVLLFSLKDESDFEVSKVAADIISKLKNSLLKYKLNEPMSDINIAPKDSSTIDTTYVKHEQSSCSINNGNIDFAGLIDDIVDDNDANLLISIYKNSMNMNEQCLETKKETLERLSKVTKQEFLSTIFHSNIDDYIQERQRWLKNYTVSFEAILDDIITANENKNINSMDCY